jgi:two-component system nitrate/nitrite response regulator NarL
MKTSVSPVSSFRRSGERQPQRSAGTTSSWRAHSSALRIVVADHHPITLAGLQSLLSGERDFSVVACCGNGRDAINAVRTYEPDVVVVDQDMPVVDGIGILKQLRSSGNQTKVVLLATANNQKLAEALSFDVEGVVFKHSELKHLIRCLREVHAGRRWLDSSLSLPKDMLRDGRELNTLTPRQIEVARAAVSGLSNKELAQRLGVSEGTIKNHLHAIYERLQLDGRLALLLHLREKALA